MTDSKPSKGVETREKLTPQKFEAVTIPLMTPFIHKSRLVRVNEENLTRLVARVLPFVNSLFPAGNAGEGPIMDFENWSQTVDITVKARDKYDLKNTFVVAGVLRKELSEISEFSAEAESLNADGIVLAPMYGGNPEQALKAALKASTLPIILYTNPDLHKNGELTVEFIEKARDNYPDRVVAIKSSTQNFAIFRKILALKNEKFKVLQGHTAFAAESLRMGADGIVPVQANLEPKFFYSLYNDFKSGDTKAMEQGGNEIARMIADMKVLKETMGMGTAQIMKEQMQNMGHFSSNRMYK